MKNSFIIQKKNYVTPQEMGWTRVPGRFVNGFEVFQVENPKQTISVRSCAGLKILTEFSAVT